MGSGGPRGLRSRGSAGPKALGSFHRLARRCDGALSEPLDSERDPSTGKPPGHRIALEGRRSTHFSLRLRSSNAAGIRAPSHAAVETPALDPDDLPGAPELEWHATT